MPSEMEFTGERFVPQIHGNIELEHIHRYLVACNLAAGKDVLDIACGEGYGSARLALSARKVYGVDISNEAVVDASANYVADNIRFLVGSCEAIPLPDRSVDLVASFETIEHHDKHDEMMLEIKRVLRSNGVVIISSSDKQTYSIEPSYQNPYPVKELFAGVFRELFSNHFRNTKHFGQKITYGSAFLEEDGSSPQKSYWDENDQIHSNGGSFKPVYLLSIASDSKPSVNLPFGKTTRISTTRVPSPSVQTASSIPQSSSTRELSRARLTKHFSRPLADGILRRERSTIP